MIFRELFLALSPETMQKGRERETYNTARRAHCLSLTIELISEALDIVQPIGDDNGVSPQSTLDGGIMCAAGLLLTAGFAVGGAGYIQGLIIDVVDSEAGIASICILGWGRIWGGGCGRRR